MPQCDTVRRFEIERLAARQYIYNWSTRTVTAGHYDRVGVRLDDGQTYFATIALR